MIIENVGVNQAPAWIHQPGRVWDSGHDSFENENLIKLNKCFEMIIENVGVNRAPTWIRQPGQVGDSGRDIFENEKFNKTITK